LTKEKLKKEHCLKEKGSRNKAMLTRLKTIICTAKKN
jgi:hypothetical protein